jgi:hypothetical protein
MKIKPQSRAITLELIDGYTEPNTVKVIYSITD